MSETTWTPGSPEIMKTLPKTHGLRDVAVIAFLAAVLGGFVAQLVSPGVAPAGEIARQAATSSVKLAENAPRGVPPNCPDVRR